MAFRPNYTPAGFDSLLDPRKQQLLAVPSRAQPAALTGSAAQPTASAEPVRAPVGQAQASTYGGIAPGAPIATPQDEYDQRLSALTEQQKKDLQAWIGSNEHVADQLRIQKEIDELQSRLAGYPAEREKAYQDFLSNGAALPDLGVRPQTPGGEGFAKGVSASNQFVEPWDPIAGQAKLDQLTQELARIQNDFATGKTAFTKGQQDYYQKVFDTVKALRAQAAVQSAIDSQNNAKIAEYEKLIAPYNQGVNAYNDYVKNQTDWQTKTDQINADLAAGKYAVDPFAYLRGQHSFTEIEELRKQINAGNFRPNMGVPVAPAAPKEVARPGEAPTGPTLQNNAADVEVGEDVAKTLGYRKQNKPNATYTQPTQVNVAPAPPPKVEAKPANPEAKPTPVKNPGTGVPTTQQLPAGATTPTIQQLPGTSQTSPQPAAPLNASTSLPQQTAGSVAGQAPAAGTKSDTAESQPTPQALANPSPFKDPDKDDKKEDRWEL